MTATDEGVVSRFLVYLVFYHIIPREVKEGGVSDFISNGS